MDYVAFEHTLFESLEFLKLKLLTGHYFILIFVVTLDDQTLKSYCQIQDDCSVNKNMKSLFILGHEIVLYKVYIVIQVIY